MAPGLDHLKILKFKVAAYNKKTKTMAYYDEKVKDEFEFISGTKMRMIARDGNQKLPEGFMEPEAWQILAQYYQGQGNGAFVWNANQFLYHLILVSTQRQIGFELERFADLVGYGHTVNIVANSFWQAVHLV